MVGVVGGEEDGGRLADRLADAGHDVRHDDAEAVLAADPGAVVAVGEGALVDLVWAGVDVPVLPVGTDEGLPWVAPDDAPAAVEALAAGDHGTRDRRLLSVVADGEPVGPAAFDVLLVRAEPGRISEYGLEAAGTRSRFRADGVVAATPAGSHGYAHAAGGPRLAADAGAVVVVPVAPFGLGAPSWVFDADGGLELRVERDEGAVTLLLDGRQRRELAGQSSVTLGPGGRLRVAVPRLD